MSQMDHEQQATQIKKGVRKRDAIDVSEFSADVRALNAGQPQSDVLSGELYEQNERVIIPFSERPESRRTSAAPACAKCNGVGWVRQPGDLPPWHPEFKSRIECECLIEKRRLKRLQEMLALCTRFGFQREKTLATYRAQVKGVLQAARETKRMIGLLTAWAAERGERLRCGDVSKLPLPKEWLVFIGPVGTGKTHLAMAVGNAALDADIVTLFATVPDLLDHLRQTFHPGSTVVYDELFERLKNAELLVLDDLGAEQSSGWADEKLFQLLNYRYNLCLPTIVTLNKQAWDCLDLRLKSRLSDKSLVEIVILDQAKDFREQQGKERR